MSSGDRWNGKCVLMAEAEDLDEMLRPQKVLKAVKSVFCKVVFQIRTDPIVNTPLP